MFGRHSGHGGNSGSSNLVEFRAGRMNMIGKMVHPDTRKGLVFLHQSDDGLMHFCWKDRTSGKTEDDLIVFPDEYEFKRVDQCKTGRVYVLKFKTSPRRMFFWMQEVDDKKDEELCRRVNELMNNPPSSQRSGNDSGDLQYMLNNMSQQQLMQLFGGVGQIGSLLGSMNRSGNSSSRTTPGSNRNANNSSSLLTPENVSSIPRTPTAPKANRSKPSNNSGNEGSDNSENSARSLNIDLSAALATSDAINEVLEDPQQVNKLSVLLPSSENADENKKQQILDTINSPQFQQALSLFSNALQSAQLGPVVSQFELTPEAVNAAYAGNIEGFMQALEKALPAGTTLSKDLPKDNEKEIASEEETKTNTGKDEE